MDIYPGFAASELLLRGGAVAGVATNDFGVAKDGTRKPTFQRGMELQARATLLAEGCRGSLSEVGPSMLVESHRTACRYSHRSLAEVGSCKLIQSHRTGCWYSHRSVAEVGSCMLV